MLKTVVISAVATLIAVMALFAGAASATGFLKRQAFMSVAAPPQQEIAGDCVVQSRWVQSSGKMIQVERPVCY